MSQPHPDPLKARLRDYFHRAYVLGDAAVIDELLAPNLITHGMGPQPLHGRDAFKQWYLAFRSSFSNITCDTTHCFVEGDWITCRIEFRGTHTGPALGPPPTGKPLTLTALILCRFHNSQIVEAYNEFDKLHLMQTLGGL